MKSSLTLSLLALISCSALRAAETVPVSGSNVQYAAVITSSVGDKKYSLKCTGAGMRKRAVFNVYAIASYVHTDFKGTTPEALASADVIKQLHLIMERNVSGKDMANAFQEAIRANYPNEFADEMKKLMDIIAAQDVDKGEQVWITHVPGYGLFVNLVGKKQEYIKSVKFAHAVWNIYLGPRNVGDTLKKSLTARLQ